MEIHQLRYFVAVAEEGSFSPAAEREHVSQPSLSQRRKNSEARKPRSMRCFEGSFGCRFGVDFVKQSLSWVLNSNSFLVSELITFFLVSGF
jgi:hypothetical protein